MPFTGPSSVPPTIDEFLQHWNTVNNSLGLTPLLVVVDPGVPPRARLDLQGQKTGFETQAAAVQGFRNDLELATGDAATARESLSALITAFNRKVRGALAHTSFPRALPDAVSTTMGNATMLRSGDDMSSLWLKINALAPSQGFTPPMLVPLDQPGSSTPLQVTQGQGANRVSTLRTALQGNNGVGGTANAEQSLQLKRGERDRVWEMEIRPLLSAYRDRILGDYPADHSFVLSLPRLYPPATGATPDPVSAAAQWVAPPGEAVVTHSATTNAEVVRYELRAVTGSQWLAEDAVVIASRLVSAPGPLEFRTVWNLLSSGDVVSMKVYVVTADGHERGSDTLTVTRP